MGNNLRRLRELRGWTHDQAADAMGVSRGSFIKLERSERRLNEDTILQAARAFQVDPGQVVQEMTDIVIVGYVGADTTGSILYNAESGDMGRAPLPPSYSQTTVAVVVRGDSMRGVAEDGWLIYYDDVRSPITEDMHGRLCVLWLPDGRVLIKTPFPSRTPGLFDLESTNSTTLREERVETAALVTALVPQKSTRKTARRN